MLHLVDQGNSSPESRSRGKGLVLLIQASTVTRNILREELEAEGYTVDIAGTGEAGLEKCQDLRPDIVLMDVGVESPDGNEVCRQLRSHNATQQIPVILVSEQGELKDKLAGFEAGASDYLSKPFFTKELLARLKAHLRSAEMLKTSSQLGDFYLEMLWGVGSTISSPFSSEDELEVILRQALAGVRASRGSLFLLDEGTGGLKVRAMQGYGEEGNPPAGDIVRISEKLPMLQSGAESEGMALKIHEDPESGRLFVPMIAKERLVGGIEVDLEGREARLSANDQKMLYALASQAAMILENARLERDARSMFLNIIVSLAGAVDAKDAYTHGHSMRVARVALRVAQQLGLSREAQETLLLSAILHDVGKIAIPDEILQKPGRLTSEEFEIMKGHTTAGARMLAHIPALEDVVPGIRNHHERWDGTGYPDGLAGDEIPLVGRIIHIGDAFDAITTDRVYRNCKPVSWAMQEIQDRAGEQFDPECVAAACEARRQGWLEDTIPEQTPTIFELIEQITG